MHIFCVSHKPPVFEAPLSYTHVTPKTYGGVDEVIVTDDKYGDAFHGRILSEYTQLFGLAEKLSEETTTKTIHIFQYRKFLSILQPPRLSTNCAFNYATRGNEAKGLFPSKGEMESLSGRHLIGPAIKVRSLAHNYSSAHLVEDFTNFCVALKALPGFNDRRLSGFINCDIFLPIPSLGSIPSDIFIEMMGELRSAWGEFAARFYQPREGYQRRVGGFLLERLHGYLLYENVKRKRISIQQGFQNVVTEKDYVEQST
jgi:hypothetical protein